MHAAQQLAGEIGNTRLACDVMAAPRASLYRRARRLAGPVLVRIAPPQPTPPRALDDAERTAVLARLHEPRFVDMAPAQVHAALLDEGTYLCSPRTMHRILADENESGERRAVRRHPPAAIPRVVATAPNQVWTWDITKLLGPVRGVSFALYVVLDLFSRFVVAWTVARRELASIAEAFLRTTCERHGVHPGQLTIHSDRGSQMTAQPVVFLFGDLGVTASLSRPRTSNDNPFSEAQFKTTKYRPDYPGRFGSLQHARSWARPFFAWYNTQHHHSALAMLTPEDVFLGRANAILKNRRHILHAAYEAHPERFVRGRPEPPALPKEVWINRPPASPEPTESH
jgi:putative transposase